MCRPDVITKEKESQLSSVASGGGREMDRLTVVLDLDECLVHSCLANGRGMKWQAGSAAPVRTLGDSFEVYFDDGEMAVVNKRPHLDAFLKAVAAEDFEVVVFTAAAADYAGAVLDRLDPTGELIHRRFYRESCRRVGLSLVKDLRAVVPPDRLHRVVLVDNSPSNFLVQPNNGVPVPPFFDQPDDTALLGVLELLQTLKGLKDVRPTLREAFGIEEALRAGLGAADVVYHANGITCVTDKGGGFDPHRMTLFDYALVVLLTAFYAVLVIALVSYVIVPLGEISTRVVGLPMLEWMSRLSGASQVANACAAGGSAVSHALLVCSP